MTRLFLLLLVLLLPVTSWAAVAVENTHTSPEVASTTVTITGHVVTSATMDIVTVCLADGTVGDRTVSSVVRNSQSYTLVATKDDGNFEHAEIWMRASPSAGTFDTGVTFSGAVDQAAASATGFTGASATLGTPTTATASTANPSVTVVDSASGDLVVSIVCSDIGAGSTTDPAGTQLWEIENAGSGDSDFNGQYQTASGASTVASWTSSAESWAAAGVAVKAPGGAPTCRPGSLMLMGVGC